jgi:rhodanese-related sulfurtransferase
MTSTTSIAIEKLSRLIGRPDAPVLIDVRTEEDFDAAPRRIPGAIRREAATVASWGRDLPDGQAVVICQRGLKLSEGVAAWLRHQGRRAENLDGGTVAWEAAGLPMVPEAMRPPAGPEGATLWVTRARPKIDRIACPWLIRRFVDPQAVFLFVSPLEVVAVAERFRATPFDIDAAGAFWTHRGDLCTFDVMVEEFGLATEPMLRLAAIVRGADTARPDLAPEAAGLLAASLGLSRMFSDDLAQLEAGLTLYDAFYRWSRDATGETHNWPAPAVGPDRL